jgi:hypothetical protein
VHYIARFVDVEGRKAKELRGHTSQGEILSETKDGETTKEIWAVDFKENFIESK